MEFATPILVFVHAINIFLTQAVVVSVCLALIVAVHMVPAILKLECVLAVQDGQDLIVLPMLLKSKAQLHFNKQFMSQPGTHGVLMIF